MSTTILRLTGATTYTFQGTTYRSGKLYDVSEALADHLLEQVNVMDAPYFSVVRAKEAEGVPVKHVEAKPEKPAPVKKAAKKTVKVGSGKVEGEGDQGGDGDDAGAGAGGEGDGGAVQV